MAFIDNIVLRSLLQCICARLDPVIVCPEFVLYEMLECFFKDNSCRLKISFTKMLGPSNCCKIREVLKIFLSIFIFQIWITMPHVRIRYLARFWSKIRSNFISKAFLTNRNGKILMSWIVKLRNLVVVYCYYQNE